MADYNVNMKQWNGTSFDNVLPLAYNAKQLGGQSLAEVKQWVQDNELLLYSGQYTGTGTHGEQSNKYYISIRSYRTCYSAVFFGGLQNQFSTRVPIILANNLTNNYKVIYYYTDSGTLQLKMKISTDKKTISWYSLKDEYVQMNGSNLICNFAAIGGHDMGGQTEWVITSSGSWVVPKTGRYMLELYGGGGGTSRINSDVAGYSGGASCQHYDSVSLVAGDNIDIVVGSGVKGQNNGGSTSFGSYSVSGGGCSSDKVAGVGAGNYGATGKFQAAHTTERNYGSGVLSKTYGYGASNTLNKSGDGAVYIKYIGE